MISIHIYIGCTSVLYVEVASASTTSTALPFPFEGRPSVDELVENIELGDGVKPFGCTEGVVEGELASCHAGMDGRPVRGRGDAGVLMVGPRLSSSAFSDFNSCWSSARDMFWDSLFFSIILE
jgi:hypothetical protein